MVCAAFSLVADEQAIGVVLEPHHRTILSAEINSPIAKIYKRMGDSFQEGELLIELDKGIFEANKIKAESAFEKADLELKAKERLFKDQALSLFELKEAEASLKNAEAELLTAKKALDATAIRGPYRGKVVRVAVEDREFAQTGKELIEVIDDSVLYARFLAPGRMFSSLKTGEKIDIFIQEIGLSVPAVMSRISPEIDPASSTIKGEALIQNGSGILRPGMLGTINFKSQTRGKPS